VKVATIGIYTLVDFLFGVRTANKLSGTIARDSCARLVFLS
jgi:hypothetical protein